MENRQELLYEWDNEVESVIGKMELVDDEIKSVYQCSSSRNICEEPQLGR